METRYALGIEFTKFGEGANNVAYKNADETLVLRIVKDSSGKFDTPERTVQNWNDINGTGEKAVETADDVIKGKGALVLTLEDGTKAVLTPFVRGIQATEDEMIEESYRIFNDTGRVVLDAVIENNFLTTEDGHTICIDIGLAVQLQRYQEDQFADRFNGRRNSVTSLEDFDASRQVASDQPSHYQLVNSRFIAEYAPPEKLSNLLRALLFIATERPDIENADFLRAKGNENLTKILSEAWLAKRKMDDISQGITKENDRSSISYQAQYAQATAILKKRQPIAEIKINGPAEEEKVTEGRKVLQTEVPLDMPRLKAFCKTTLQDYIDSRGSMDDEGHVKLSFRGMFTTNHDRAVNKIIAVNELIKKIDDTETPKDIETLIDALRDRPEFQDKRFSHGLKVALDVLLGKCQVVCDAAQRALIEEEKLESNPPRLSSS